SLSLVEEQGIVEREHHCHRMTGQGLKCCVKMVWHTSLQGYELDPQRSGRAFQGTSPSRVRRIAGIHQQTDLAGAWNHFDRGRELSAREILARQQPAGDIGAGSCMAGR